MHPLKNGSQATARPANKPLVGTAGWFTESGENNVPSYPGADWFNHNIAEFQAALAEMGVVFDPENEDHLAKAFRGINQRLGAKVMGVINVSEIINNDPEFILPITPELGPYVTLEGHGAANFTITGFGDECPIGYVFSLLMPRTIANTGGTANSLGSYVQFLHSSSGTGIDMAINARQSGASTLYTYQAYPNATDSFGNLAALFEIITFLHTGMGRWSLVNLPDSFSGRNGNGQFSRGANGIANVKNTIFRGTTPQSTPAGNLFATTSNLTDNYPASFFSVESFLTTMRYAADAPELFGYVTVRECTNSLIRYRFLTPTAGSTTGTSCSWSVDGNWKPNV